MDVFDLCIIKQDINGLSLLQHRCSAAQLLTQQTPMACTAVTRQPTPGKANNRCIVQHSCSMGLVIPLLYHFLSGSECPHLGPSEMYSLHREQGSCRWTTMKSSFMPPMTSPRRPMTCSSTLPPPYRLPCSNNACQSVAARQTHRHTHKTKACNRTHNQYVTHSHVRACMKEQQDRQYYRSAKANRYVCLQ